MVVDGEKGAESVQSLCTYASRRTRWKSRSSFDDVTRVENLFQCVSVHVDSRTHRIVQYVCSMYEGISRGRLVGSSSPQVCNQNPWVEMTPTPGNPTTKRMRDLRIW